VKGAEKEEEVEEEEEVEVEEVGLGRPVPFLPCPFPLFFTVLLDYLLE